jgi:hypothetical protein
MTTETVDKGDDYIDLSEPTAAPDWLESANLYGAELVRSGKPEAAIVTFKRALELSPHSYELWANLGSALWQLRQYEPALAALRRSLEIAPGYPIALANLGLVYEGLGEFELSEASFGEAVENDPDYIDAIWDRSLLRLGRGDYERGFEEYDMRIERKRDSIYPHLPMPMWQGEDLTGKTIHVECEQGIGDTIMFSRFLPWLSSRAEKVYFCAGRSVSLLWSYRQYVEFIPPRVPLPEADFYTYMASIPRWYGLRFDAIPADSGLITERVRKSRTLKLPQPTSTPALKIGVAWTGNPEMERNDERSIPFRHMLQFAQSPVVWLYSLQVGHGAADIAKLGAEGLVCDPSKELENNGYVATGEAILNCDLVITCCTSIAHLAGALGVPCWVLLCKDPYWPWLYSERTDSPWYPSIRLFRQREAGNWQPVIAEARDALNDLIRDKFATP